jgi:hypothetical protein
MFGLPMRLKKLKLQCTFRRVDALLKKHERKLNENWKWTPLDKYEGTCSHCQLNTVEDEIHLLLILCPLAGLVSISHKISKTNNGCRLGCDQIIGIATPQMIATMKNYFASKGVSHFQFSLSLRSCFFSQF